jgi:flagellar biosynthesis protein FlhA
MEARVAAADSGISMAGFMKSSSAVLAFGVVGILLVMMVPLPTLLLDILLSMNIAISLIILLMSLYVLRPLDFSVFPSVLLVVTLLRLSKPSGPSSWGETTSSASSSFPSSC